MANVSETKMETKGTTARVQVIQEAARGQARIPSIVAARRLMDQAVSEGWGPNEG